jgi:hypothetical protein
MPLGDINTQMSLGVKDNGGFQIQSARKKNDVSDFQVFGIKMTGHTGLEEKSKKN